MASGMASYVESLAREVKEMDDRIEYLASKRLWAENKLQTEKLKTGKELSLKMLLVETKRAQKKSGSEHMCTSARWNSLGGAEGHDTLFAAIGYYFFMANTG